MDSPTGQQAGTGHRRALDRTAAAGYRVRGALMRARAGWRGASRWRFLLSATTAQFGHYHVPKITPSAMSPA